VCAWCGRFMGIKEVENATLPISHSICCKCKEKLLAEADEALQRHHETQQLIERR
jgi:hypothetical protein